MVKVSGSTRPLEEESLSSMHLRSGFRPPSGKRRSPMCCENKKEIANAFYQNRTSDLVMSNRSLNLLVTRSAAELRRRSSSMIPRQVLQYMFLLV